MPFTITENWDAATPPALPSGWTTDGGSMGTDVARNLSSPNGLGQVGGTTAVIHYATNNTADPNGGSAFSASAAVLMTSSTSIGVHRVGITFRCSSNAMNNSTTSCYLAHISWTGSFKLSFDKIVNGTLTNFAAVTNTDSGLARESWYQIGVVTNGLDLFNIRLTRVSDGYTMNGSGVFAPSVVDAISGFSAPDIASGSYYGIASSANFGAGYVFSDDFGVNATAGPTMVIPRKPVVVRVPFQFYHPD